MDEDKLANEQARNNLESHIFETQDAMYSEAVVGVSTEEQREVILAALREASNWMEEEAYGAKTKVSEEVAALPSPLPSSLFLSPPPFPSPLPSFTPPFSLLPFPPSLHPSLLSSPPSRLSSPLPSFTPLFSPPSFIPSSFTLPPLQLLKDKLRELKKVSRSLFKRLKETEERPKLIDALRSSINISHDFSTRMRNLSKEMQIFTEVEMNTLETLTNETEVGVKVHHCCHGDNTFTFLYQ